MKDKIVKITAPINGMHCASCALTIEKTLKKADGVISCEVNYGTEKAKLEFDPEKTSLKELSKKIEKYGYELWAMGSEPDHKNELHLNSEHEQHNLAHSPQLIAHSPHSEHLGLNQTKEQKLNELQTYKNKIEFVMPITIMLFGMMMWEIAAKYFEFVPKFFIPHDLYNLINFVLATIVLFWIGKPYIDGFLMFLKHKVANMDTLVGIGTLTAYLYSSIIFLIPKTRELLNLENFTYFDVTVVVIGFITFGKYLEIRSKLRTGEAIEKLINLQAKTALIDHNGHEMEVPVEQVQIGNIIIVKPGSKIPIDGEIIEGNSSIDESMITGEAIPVDKKIGDFVIGGTINKQGYLKFKATKIGSDTMLAQIIKMVEEAQGSRAPIQRLADQISSVFVPAVLIIALATILIWIIVGSQFMPMSDAVSYGIASFVGVLIIACPCALGLATPTAIIVGTGKGAENGILIKNAESLEKLNKVKIIVTDKTGTITEGKPIVTDVIGKQFSVDSKNLKELWNIIVALESRSEHPLAQAMVEKGLDEGVGEGVGVGEVTAEEFENLEGKGVSGKVGGEKYYIGNVALMNQLGTSTSLSMTKEWLDTINKLTSEGKTPVIFANENEIIAVFGISDTVKQNAKETVERLHAQGIKVILLTGDSKQTAKYIAEQVGIDEVIAEVLPAQKAEKVKELQTSGQLVAMVGDGINDAPALAQADVGIAMGTGTDIAIESAEITLLKGDFSKVLKSIRLSKFTMRAIKQNLFWAFVYNIVGIPLAAGLFFPAFGWTLNPAFAGLAMAFSSVSVVANSLRLKLVKI